MSSKNDKERIKWYMMRNAAREADEAKQKLRDKGYGWTGLGISETVDIVPPANKHIGGKDGN